MYRIYLIDTPLPPIVIFKFSIKIPILRIYLILNSNKNYFIRMWLKCVKILQSSLVVIGVKTGGEQKIIRKFYWSVSFQQHSVAFVRLKITTDHFGCRWHHIWMEESPFKMEKCQYLADADGRLRSHACSESFIRKIEFIWIKFE